MAQLSDHERKELFSETASILGVTPAIVEKDFWVSWTLYHLFNDESLADQLMFKGGTSLSKVFGLIERFSEDIDLILNWDKLTSEDMKEPRSKTKDVKLSRDINELAASYIADTLYPKINELVKPVCECSKDDDPFVLNIRYSSAFPDEYLRPEIRLEIGPMAAWTPFEERAIHPLVHEAFPDLIGEPEFALNVIKAKRTFWEKATILHHEANRPKEAAPQPLRYSRHYYDLAMMVKSDVKDEALSDVELLNDVVLFKQRFYGRGWAKYEEARPGSFKLIPKSHVLDITMKDYENMKAMIYGEYPSFSEIFEVLEGLEAEINCIK